ncbi:MAG TPA: Hpt domain-containing protein, partial [Ramlibacter sp.]|nr:Hpt domain-containing protein [Ramlibacter sp.]
QFRQMGDALTRLHPPMAPLGEALATAGEEASRGGLLPGPELAMEVATAILYLEAAFQDLDPGDAQLAVRAQRLAARLDSARAGGQAEALEPWMEELYRRVSDRQTMGSVVGELRVTLNELEKDLDAFFRKPTERGLLMAAPGRLAQMRGVLSVLGLDQAAMAVLRMREGIEALVAAEDIESVRADGGFEALGNNLGALGFLIDMLNYQPVLAKKLFVYDEVSGELRPLMGRTHAAPPEPAVEPAAMAPPAVAPLADHAAPSLGFFELPLVAPSADAPAPPQEQTQTQTQTPQAPVDGFPADAVFEAIEAPTLGGWATNAHESLAADGELVAPSLEAPVIESPALEAPAFEASAFEAPAFTAEPVADAIPAAPLFSGSQDQELEQILVPVEPLFAAAPAPLPPPELVSPPQAPTTAYDSIDEELLAIFLEEAREVVQNGRAALDGLEAAPDDQGELTVLRRAFHTLKGSSRMVGLDAFGEAGWTMEQVVNVWLADGKPASDGFCQLARGALRGFAQWAEDIAAGRDPGWTPAMFSGPAEAFQQGLAAVAFAFPVEVAETAEAIEAVEAVEAIDEGDTASAEPDAFPEETEAAFAASGEDDSSGVEVTELGSMSKWPDDQVALEEPEVDDAMAPTLEPSMAMPEPPPALEPEPVRTPLTLVENAVDTSAESPLAADPLDDQIKVIGSLRIGIPLYNVYLNEADEWSRRLQTELSEWALELTSPLPDSTVGLAHALAGASATVGFHALSDIARALEHSLQHTQQLAWGTQQHGDAYNAAAEEIRRLLHQFAAGFLKAPEPGIAQALDALSHLHVPLRAQPGDSGFGADAVDPYDDELAARGEPIDADPPVLPAVPTVPAVMALEATPVAEVAHAPLNAPARLVTPSELSLPVASLDDQREGIDVLDAIDPDLFPIFEEEAQELLPQLSGALRQWAARPENRSARDEVLRALHTLKGSARLAGALRMGEMAHRMESLIEQLGGEGVFARDIEPLLHRLDALQENFESLRHATEPLPEPAPNVSETASAVHAVAAEPDATPTEAAPAEAPARTQLALPVTTSLVTQRVAANQAVRVRSQLLDRMMNQAGEVMITRSRMEAELAQLRTSLGDLTGNMDRLRSQLRVIELQAESQMQSRLAQSRDTAANFDPLEFDRFTRVQELTRMMAESVNDIATVQRNLQRTVEATEDDLIAQARQTRELQRDLLRTRMVEFEAISDRLYRVVRLASKETGKHVRLDIEGGSIEMDRGVLDRMTPAFEHLLRNCVAHGVETPAERSAAGKDATGQILIVLRQEGNDVSVQFQDDGAGLDFARIQARAVEQKLLRPGQILTEAEAANLIFMPGFSTAGQVTELSGRGIGMDVVRSEVQALGGRIETQSRPGQGTSFRLVLPLTTAVTQVVMLRAGAMSAGVPANLVEIVRRATTKDVQQAYNSGVFEHAGEELPFYWGGALLQSSRRSLEPQLRTMPVVVFRSAAQRIAVHVDEVLGTQEVVVKNLGPQLSRLPGLAGMTVLASGAVVLIYNPVALATVYGEQAGQFGADRAQPHVLEAAAGGAATAGMLDDVPPQVPLVLVVDDSITVRRVTQRLLQREGYRVAVAADGLLALERLAEERPSVVLSDIEMPRMDGFDLARNIRGDARLADLPIIMITSRIAQKHREHAAEIGVNHYLGKPYSEEELLSLVRRYCATVTAGTNEVES